MITTVSPAERYPRLAAGSAVALGLLLGAAILTLWMREGWIGFALEGIMFALAALWTGTMVFSSASPRFSGVLVPLAIPIVIGAIQLASGSTVNRWATQNALLGWGTCWAAAFAGLQTGSSERVRSRLRRGLLYFGFGVAILAVLQFFTSPEKIFWLFEGEYAEPVLGPFLSRDRYAAFVELVLPLALYESFAGKAVRVSYTAMAAAMVASVIAGASRAGSVLVLAESAAVLWLLSRNRVFRRPRAGRVAAWSATFAVLFTAVVGWTHLWDRMRDPQPYHYRREMLLSTVSMIRERPWTGFGLGSFETVYPAYATFDTGKVVDHAHNDWAEWAAEGGLPMAAALLVVVGWAGWAAVRRPWGLGVVAVSIHSLVDFPMQERALAFWVFTLMGLMLAEARVARLRGAASSSGYSPAKYAVPVQTE
jgi:O-antigen ligase